MHSTKYALSSFSQIVVLELEEYLGVESDVFVVLTLGGRRAD